jgi:hypothetical protein
MTPAKTTSAFGRTHPTVDNLPKQLLHRKEHFALWVCVGVIRLFSAGKHDSHRDQSEAIALSKSNHADRMPLSRHPVNKRELTHMDDADDNERLNCLEIPLDRNAPYIERFWIMLGSM